MKPPKWSFRLSQVYAVIFALLLSSSSVYSQERMQTTLTDPRMVVIPWRSMAEIGYDVEHAQASKRRSQDRRVQAETRLREIEFNIDSRKLNSKDADRRRDDAKTGNRESELVSLKIEQKADKQAVDLLRRVAELRKAEIEEAQVETERADLEIAALQMESELMTKRAEYDSLSGAGTGELSLTTAQQVLRDVEIRLLKMQQERAGMTQKLASKQKDIITQRMKLHEAKLKLGIPRR